MSHRWSGWPGAFCLDCFIPDPMEECLAIHDLTPTCTDCGMHWPMDECLCAPDGKHNTVVQPCMEHLPTECPNASNR